MGCECVCLLSVFPEEVVRVDEICEKAHEEHVNNYALEYHGRLGSEDWYDLQYEVNKEF